MGFFAPDAGFGTGVRLLFFGLMTVVVLLIWVYHMRDAAYTINLNENFIGIADAAISDTATGSVTIKGGIATNTSLPTLTPNSVYYVQGDGTISTTSTSPAVRLGKALSSTSINLEFNSLTNLSELLPSGGGAKEFDAVASGTLAYWSDGRFK